MSCFVAKCQMFLSNNILATRVSCIVIINCSEYSGSGASWSFWKMREAGKGAAGSGSCCTVLHSVNTICTDCVVQCTVSTDSCSVQYEQSLAHCEHRYVQSKFNGTVHTRVFVLHSAVWRVCTNVCTSAEAASPFNPIKTHPGQRATLSSCRNATLHRSTICLFLWPCNVNKLCSTEKYHYCTVMH